MSAVSAQPADAHLDARKRKTALTALVLVIAMVGLSFAAVPLYETFCRVTGFGGTTQVSDVDDGRVILDRTVEVRFSASTHRDMPWSFAPVQNTVDVKVGADTIVYYEAYNPTDKPIVGTATFNVVPFKAGAYFAKIECFCFTEQRLEPGQRVEMPILFFVDPEMADDRAMDNVSEITLNYTFFLDEEASAAAQADT